MDFRHEHELALAGGRQFFSFGSKVYKTCGVFVEVVYRHVGSGHARGLARLLNRLDQQFRSDAQGIVEVHKRAAEKHNLAPVVTEVLDEILKSLRGES